MAADDTGGLDGGTAAVVSVAVDGRIIVRVRGEWDGGADSS